MEHDDDQPETRVPEAVDLDGCDISELLDGIQGSYERTRLGLQQALERSTIPLDEL